MTGTVTIRDPRQAHSEPMSSDPFAPDAPSLEAVLAALDDPDCHDILEALDHPMTASELAAELDIPESTMYRKLDRLSDAALVEERIEIRGDGRHATRYALDFEEVRVSLADDRSLDVEIERRSQSPEDRLSELWSEVSQET